MLILLVHWLITAIAVLVAGWILPGVKVEGFGTALAVAAVLGILNTLFGWLLYIFFGIITLGIGFLLSFLTWWFVNTLLLRLTDALIGGLRIRSWGMTAVAALVISFVSALGRYLLHG